jgi:cell division transport system permease protein
MRALNYFFDEALASLWRGYKTAIVAIATIAAALFVLGGFLVLTSNMDRLLARWQEAAEFSVYLRDDSTPGQLAAIENTLHESHLVGATEEVSKSEALRRFKRNFGDLSAATEDLPDNPLPASIEVRLLPNADPNDVESLAGRTSKLPGVADIRYDRRWIERLIGAERTVRAGGFALAGVLIFAAALTVASVVRFALLARREEIHIMQLVGAPLAYIRGPFVVEGLLQGGLGALAAVAILWGAFVLIRSRQGPTVAGVVDVSSIAFLSVPMCVALLAGGMVVGCIGGVIAAQGAREVADPGLS